ncbi:MAG: hypothetical protein AMXMBFR81_03950 [Chthonomonas sp.]
MTPSCRVRLTHALILGGSFAVVPVIVKNLSLVIMYWLGAMPAIFHWQKFSMEAYVLGSVGLLCGAGCGFAFRSFPRASQWAAGIYVGCLLAVAVATSLGGHDPLPYLLKQQAMHMGPYLIATGFVLLALRGRSGRLLVAP